MDGNTLKRSQTAPKMVGATKSRRTDYSALRQLTSIREQRRIDDKAYKVKEKERRDAVFSKITPAGQMPAKYERAYQDALSKIYADADGKSIQQIQREVTEAQRIAGIGGAINKQLNELYKGEIKGTRYTTSRLGETFEDDGQPFDLNTQANKDVQHIKNNSGDVPNEQKIITGLNKSLSSMLDNNPEFSASIINGLRVAKTKGTVTDPMAKEAIRTAIKASQSEGFLRNEMEKDNYEGTIEDYAFDRWEGFLDKEKVDLKPYKLDKPKEDKENGFRSTGNGWTDGIYNYTRGESTKKVERRLPQGKYVDVDEDIETITLSRSNKDVKITPIDFYDSDGELQEGRLREIRRMPDGSKELVVMKSDKEMEVFPYDKNEEILLGEYNLDNYTVDKMFKPKEGEESTSKDKNSKKEDSNKKPQFN